MIIIAFIVSLLAGFVGGAIGMAVAQQAIWGVILEIAVMGVFILYYIKKKVN